MGRQEEEQLCIKVTHSFANTLYWIDCCGTWKRTTADVLCPIPYLLADLQPLVRLRIAPVDYGFLIR